MATGVTPEAILEDVLRVLAVDHALANVGRHEAVVAALAADVLAADDEVGPVLEVRVAPGQGVGARLAKEVLHAVGDEPDARQGERQAEPADVQLPELALPDERLGGAPRHGVARHQEDGDDEDHDNGDAAVEEDEEPRGNGLILCEGKPTRGGGKNHDTVSISRIV